MKYEDIEKACAGMSTMDFKGKDYVLVPSRVKSFRKVCPEGTIQTEIVSMENGVVTMKASIYLEDKLLATGYAQEKEGSSYINKTSYIENCETSAIGRALGFCGFGIDASIASAEELLNAVNNQGKKDEPKQQDAPKPSSKKITEGLYLEIETWLKGKYPDEISRKKYEKILEDNFKVKSLKDITMTQYEALKNKMAQ